MRTTRCRSRWRWIRVFLMRDDRRRLARARRRHRHAASAASVRWLRPRRGADLRRARDRARNEPSCSGMPTEAITDLPRDTAQALVSPLRAAYRTRANDATLAALAQHAIAALAGPCAFVERHRSAHQPRDRLGEGAARFIGVARATRRRVAHLSPSRFRHLFVAQTGVSFRAYLLWARVASGRGRRDGRAIVDGRGAGSRLRGLRASQPHVPAHVRHRARHPDQGVSSPMSLPKTQPVRRVRSRPRSRQAATFCDVDAARRVARPAR